MKRGRRERRAVPFALGLALATLAIAPAARAQADAQTYEEERTGAGTAIVFKEDVTTGSTLDSGGSLVRAPSAAFRMGLVRPRLNFVSEMLKSVESL